MLGPVEGRSGMHLRAAPPVPPAGNRGSGDSQDSCWEVANVDGAQRQQPLDTQEKVEAWWKDHEEAIRNAAVDLLEGKVKSPREDAGRAANEVLNAMIRMVQLGQKIAAPWTLVEKCLLPRKCRDVIRGEKVWETNVVSGQSDAAGNDEEGSSHEPRSSDEGTAARQAHCRLELAFIQGMGMCETFDSAGLTPAEQRVAGLKWLSFAIKHSTEDGRVTPKWADREINRLARAQGSDATALWRHLDEVARIAGEREDLSDKRIAELLEISQPSVSNHWKSAAEKLRNYSNRPDPRRTSSKETPR